MDGMQRMACNLSRKGRLMSEPTSITLDEHLDSQLATLAALTERPKTWHVERALRDYISREMEFLAAVEEGLRADEAGDLVEHADAVAELDRAIDAARRS
jgi:predicted transcriptional regulator